MTSAEHTSSSVSLPREIEKIITRGLQRVAQKAEFELTELYHNESVWYLKRVRGALTERLQVAAFGSPIDPTLRLIPDISEEVNEPGVRRMSSAIVPEAIVSVRVHSLWPGRAKDPEQLVEAAAWEAITRLQSLEDHERDRIVRLRMSDSSA